MRCHPRFCQLVKKTRQRYFIEKIWAGVCWFACPPMLLSEKNRKTARLKIKDAIATSTPCDPLNLYSSANKNDNRTFGERELARYHLSLKHIEPIVL